MQVYLREALHPWLAVSTWHTTHPLDGERFHKALDAALRNGRRPIMSDNLREAIVALAAEMHPDMLPRTINEAADYYASTGERISIFMADTGRI